MRKFTDYFLLYLKGMCMGAADVIPGVSGGTIAFITGIYEELINSIKAIDIEAFTLLGKFRFAAFWKKINGTFLLTIFLGIATSILSLARLMTYLLQTHPIQVWSFFFGLILVSAPLILREITKWDIGTVAAALFGVACAYFITVSTPAQTPDSLVFVFLCGCLAICAMILPGISGAFILLLLGKYAFVLNALHDLNYLIILVFCAGCFFGLLSFARLLGWVLKYYRFVMLALLSGFMIGSLNKVWPWKEVLSYRIASDGQQIPAMDRSVLPGAYFDQTGQDPQIFQAILFVAVGILLVVAIEKISRLAKSNH